ncbi:MAG: 16S rRNA (guanine(966)-N(2))-methyltransferase RsmD [Chlamydiales bacterium]|nr:16S rRNA (guanine(966)-N(2))-methyltransferase RsmD [Chlamydiales bacterium]
MRIIAGQFRQRALVAPKGAATRPTSSVVREALFNICQGYIEDADFLDLYGGSGAMGLEALSRGARSATFVENDSHAIKALRQNIETLGVKGRAILLPGSVGTVMNQLHRMGKRYHIIYADPPYDAHSAVKDLLVYLESKSLLEVGGDLFIEESLKAPDPQVDLSKLMLKSHRNYGKSRLSHYVEVQE